MQRYEIDRLPDGTLYVFNPRTCASGLFKCHTRHGKPIAEHLSGDMHGDRVLDAVESWYATHSR
jgi:hypothetical protein